MKDQVLMILKQQLTATNPTADRTITIPDETGTIITTGSLGVVTSAMLASGTITGGDIADDSIGIKNC